MLHVIALAFALNGYPGKPGTNFPFSILFRERMCSTKSSMCVTVATACPSNE